MARRKPSQLKAPVEQDDYAAATRALAESSFISFIRLVFPSQVLGGVHEELCQWMTRQEAKDHQLILMPRDHGKSRFAAFYALWMLTRDPTMRILYISNTSTLAEKQLGFIKDIMEREVYQRYWPEMCNPEEGKRKRWTTTEIAVDHPKRVEAGIRDPSIMVAGLTTSIVGLHFDLAVLDDVVTGDNAYTEDGREKVNRQYSFLASIEGAEAKEVVVGTRYHPKDLYEKMIAMKVDIFNEAGEIIDQEEVYEIFERKVESRGDGTGEFLWPRQLNTYDNKWYGFDQKILATKKAKYIDRTQFYAQYYNNPNSAENAAIRREHFQYYDPALLKQSAGYWYYKGSRLNIIAAADLSYTMSKRSDYTAVVIVGIDADRNHFILDIDRYKTNSIKEQFEHILALHKKWDFKKIIIEAQSAAESVVEELKNSYFRPNGLMITVQMEKPTRHEGTKEERNSAILNPRYENMAMWHYRGGNCQTLEEELSMAHPPHDDIKDAVANAVKHIAAPSQQHSFNNEDDNVISIFANNRFRG